MKTFGKLSYCDGVWKISAEPHVMIRLKAVLNRINKNQFNEVEVKHGDQVCRDLEWFVDRYPLAIDANSEEVLKRGSQRYKQTLESLEKIAVPSYQPRTFSMAVPPRDYQSRAVEIYLKRKSLLLADQLGLGKSITAICSLTEPETLPALIVCATHLQEQWQDYLSRFMPSLRVHIISKSKNYNLPASDAYIITYHKLSSWAETLKLLVKSIIFDEVQELRHDGSGKYCAAAALRESCKYVMGLSATPIYNYGGEIFNIIDMLAPGELGSRDEFEREWCVGRGGHSLLREPDAFGTYLREQFLMLRRTRIEVGRELPPVETIIQRIEHRQECLAEIDNLATELAHRILHGQFEEQGMAAREFDMKLRQATGIAKAPYVAAFVKMLAQTGEKILLTGWHRAVYDVWKDKLQSGIDPLTPTFYTGTESPAQKQQAKEDFLSGRCPVMIMSLRSGVGLDGLQEACQTIVHGELDWSPGVHEQCRGRLHRDGQSAHINEFYLISEGGSDPVIADILGLKRSQVSGILEPCTGGLAKLQTDSGARVKRMAQEFLRNRGLLH